MTARPADHLSGLGYTQVLGLDEALLAFLEGGEPDLNAVARWVFVAARRSEPRVPDHFYLDYIDYRFGTAHDRGRDQSDRRLLLTVLDGLADRYFDRERDGLTIKTRAFGDWQNALPALSPLLVAAGAASRPRERDRFPPQWTDMAARLRRDLSHSALFGARVASLNDLIAREGLNEMHMHLNGATELDHIWLDWVAKPYETKEFLEAGLAKPRRRGDWEMYRRVREQYDQVEPGLTPSKLFGRLRAARRVRWMLARIVLEDAAVSVWDMQRLMHATVPDRAIDVTKTVPLSRHPGYWFPAALCQERDSDLLREGTFLALCIGAVRDGGSKANLIARGLWFQTLVMNQAARLVVQQTHQYGFDQFQKITLNESRERLEKRFQNRFHQITWSEHGDHDLLEGRFAPKDVPNKLEKLLRDIVTGFAQYRGCKRAKRWRTPLSGEIPACLRRDLDGTPASCPRCDEDPRQLKRPRLALVVHFIKQPDKPTGHVLGPRCRHYALRQAHDQQANVLLKLLHHSAVARHLVTGIDAAANELDAPPEVFAPLFRRLRHAGIRHATYHAGEDFKHLAGGIRAVWEAVTFLDLRDGDRIGHGTALGIDPTLWTTRMPRDMVVPRGEALDDAVFAYWRLARCEGHAQTRARLADRIAEWSEVLYGEPIGPDTLRQAWQLRERDPRLIRESPHATWISPDRQAEADRLDDARQRMPKAFEIFEMYHAPERRSRFRELVPLTDGEGEVPLYQPHDLHALQQDAVKMLNDRHVVIETLPTSNVRISLYGHHAEHHLYRWLGVCDPEGFSDTHRPTVCVGSDDTGIFATNLRNEYSHIYLTLRDTYGYSDQAATDMIRRLNDNGRRHFFTEEMPESAARR